MRKLSTARNRSRLATLAVTGLLASLSIVGLASPAQAATCTGWTYKFLNASVASASVWLSDTCSDGRIHVEGTVWDNACDNRYARLNLNFYHDGDLNGVFFLYRNENVYAEGGCGSSVGYAYNTENRTIVSNDMYLRACVWAANTWGSSSQACELKIWP